MPSNPVSSRFLLAPTTPLGRLLRHRVRPAFIRLFHAYMRHVPFVVGKRLLWRRFAVRFLDGAAHPFVTKTVFGARIAGNTEDFIQSYIYYFGVWEPHLTHFIEERLARGDTFVDVGANIGYFSLLASSLVGSRGTVVAIEASPGIFAQLQANIALNRADNIRALNVAVTDQETTVTVYRASAGNIGMTTIIRDRLKTPQHECEVKGLPLGSLLSPRELASARLIKIDVEGAEWGVAKGLVPQLEKARADVEVVMEVSPEPAAGQEGQGDEIIRMFSEAGFHAYSLENDYSGLSYLRPQTPKRPVRMRGNLDQQTDMVFSRLDASTL